MCGSGLIRKLVTAPGLITVRFAADNGFHSASNRSHKGLTSSQLCMGSSLVIGPPPSPKLRDTAWPPSNRRFGQFQPFRNFLVRAAFHPDQRQGPQRVAASRCDQSRTFLGEIVGKLDRRFGMGNAIQLGRDCISVGRRGCGSPPGIPRSSHFGEH